MPSSYQKTKSKCKTGWLEEKTLEGRLSLLSSPYSETARDTALPDSWSRRGKPRVVVPLVRGTKTHYEEQVSGKGMTLHGNAPASLSHVIVSLN